MLGSRAWNGLRAMDPASYAETLIARASHWSRTRRYATATVLVAVATVARFAFETSLRDNNYFLFVTAVALCALFLDWRSAAWATVLSSFILEYAFLEPRYTFAIEAEHAVALGLFVLGCTLVVIGGQSMQLLVRRLNRTQAEKDALYRELRHRTYNNLQIIGATIAMEAGRAGSPEMRDSLKGIANRIAAIGQVDQLLGARSVADAVDAATYLHELCGFITTSLVGRRPIMVDNESEAIRIPRDVAETLGIAINELVTNAVKYAFAAGATGHIRVRLASEPDGVVLTVEDDGRGCTSKGDGGTGWRLVSSLTGRHRGTMAVEDAAPGCRVRIRVPCEWRPAGAKAEARRT